MSAFTIIIRTKDLLFEEGWSPSARRGAHGPRCVFWALTDAAGIDRQAGREAIVAFREAIGTSDIDGWNDTPGRTFDEIVEALERTGKIAEIAA